MHFAATLKKLLAILLVLLLAGQTSGYFIAIAHEAGFVQSDSEKSETGLEEKKEKECTTFISLIHTATYIKSLYCFYSVDPDLSPATDILTPPPDIRPYYMTT